MAHDTAAALTKIGDLARQRNDEGAASLSDATQTDARIEEARTVLTQYQASLDRWRATQATCLGRPSVKQVSDDFPDSLMRSCAASKADDQLILAVLVAWAQGNQAQAKLDNANAQMLPTISLEPQVTHYLNNHYANSELIDRTQYSAFVKVEMPLYRPARSTPRGCRRASSSIRISTCSSAPVRCSTCSTPSRRCSRPALPCSKPSASCVRCSSTASTAPGICARRSP
nr:type I secretion outer membrane protein, TolC family [Candidatus Pantoea persica]